jgi:hypothetical protein
LLLQTADCPAAFASANAGKSMAAKIAMIAMTTSSSMRVKAKWFCFLDAVFIRNIIVNKSRVCEMGVSAHNRRAWLQL